MPPARQVRGQVRVNDRKRPRRDHISSGESSGETHASGMGSRHVSITLWAFDALVEKGLEVDAAAVRAASE